MNLLRSYSQFYKHSLLRTKLIGTFFSKSISCSSCPRHRGKMGLFEILVKRELTLECLQLSSSPLLNNACMPTIKSKLNEVLKISCMSDNMDISKMWPILPRLPLTVTSIWIAKSFLSLSTPRELLLGAGIKHVKCAYI